MQNMDNELAHALELLENMQKKIQALEQVNQLLIRSERQTMEYMQNLEAEFADYKENAVFELRAALSQIDEFWYPDIHDSEEAVQRIVNEGCSIARFGDGEFSAIAGRIRHRFQTVVDDKLAERLKEVLRAKDEKLLIAIADNYGSLEAYTDQAKREIRRYMKRSVRREHLNLLEKGRVYYDTYITRPYVMYADHDTDAPKKRFERLKQLWQNRNCIFVEGCYTGLGMGNDLFAGAKGIQRILAPAENAFLKYGEILGECLHQKKDTLFLIALGPAATVLAHDLCMEGYQALDIGHIDLEYEWFLRGEGCRTVVDGKYNNEMPQEQELSLFEDAEYKKQVIADLS